MSRESKYRLLIENEGELRKMGEWRFSKRTLLLCVVIGVFIPFILAVGIIAFTPIRQFIPGYASSGGYGNNIADEVIRLDSLKRISDMNQAYIENLMKVMNPDRVPDDSVVFSGKSNHLTSDSLMDRTEAEQEFIAGMTDRERYNISVLAPLAADGMMFYPVARGSVVTEATRDSLVSRVLIPAGETINSITDGKIIDRYYSAADRGYTLIIQQPKGFITRYGNLGTVLVKKGQNVNGGEAIALTTTATGSRKNIITVEMWHNGAPLMPKNYIYLYEDRNLKNER
jgi:Peptidase family M23